MCATLAGPRSAVGAGQGRVFSILAEDRSGAAADSASGSGLHGAQAALHSPTMSDLDVRGYIAADLPNWHRAVDSRDPLFDGVFFVAITSTRIYCRPVCPSRLARRENRRFFTSCADAERSGFRACKRCCPGRAHGEAPVDAVPRLAHRVVARISSGALDGRTVGSLAGELGMSERHLRRALTREMGVPPFRLALEQRLANAARLLTETRHLITRVAYASGFQSLRSFNAAFSRRFAMSPTEWRRRSLTPAV